MTYIAKRAGSCKCGDGVCSGKGLVPKAPAMISDVGTQIQGYLGYTGYRGSKRVISPLKKAWEIMKILRGCYASGGSGK